MEFYPTVPGRGLLTHQSILARLDHLRNLGFAIDELSDMRLDHQQLQKNIESLIGSIELPVGLVGPLAVAVEGNEQELAFTAAGTLEGALVASMNRGAKAITLSGGCTTVFHHQRMVRVPMFYLKSEEDALQLKAWTTVHFERIKAYVEGFSNHAVLRELIPVVDENHLHLEFVYTTGDASGQNMTTTCTWHGILWLREHFTAETRIEILDLIIEGNGSSDKKVSSYLAQKGRGCKVTASADLDEEVIRKVLRTSSEAFLKSVEPSRKLARENGMPQYNINVANAIAAIFVATGQDLACIHESSLGELTLTKTEKGLRFELMLPSLVVGTVGGGTHLTDRKQALELMGCAGNGKVERFAQLIAAFALALEISTYSAIISGEFATAHEKLGRNKPIEWLTRSDLNLSFFQSILGDQLAEVQMNTLETEKGILTLLAKRVNKKFSGLLSLELSFETEKHPAVVKNKPTDWEIVKGLHLISSSIDTELAHLLVKYKEQLEYHRCHLKELTVYQWSKDKGLAFPHVYGIQKLPKRECFLVVLEDISVLPNVVMDAENKPQLWTVPVLEQLLDTLIDIQVSSMKTPELEQSLGTFDAFAAMELYERLLWITTREFPELAGIQLTELFQQWKQSKPDKNELKTLTHSDFNPRNVAFYDLDQGTAFKCYDWELALWHYPLRDVMELLCFVADDPTDEELLQLIRYYLEHFKAKSGKSFVNEKHLLRWCLLEFLFTRATFYVSAQVVLDIKFANRLLKNGMRLAEVLKKLE